MIDVNKTHSLKSDLIELSDLFRRMARFDEQDAVARLVEMTRRLGCAITYLRPEYDMDNKVNQAAINDIALILKDMDMVASGVGLPVLVLPLHEDDPFSDIIKLRILDGADYGTEFAFRDSNYTQDLNDEGYIRAHVKTFLDEGIRGLGAIDSELKYKWDRDARNDGQYNLGL